MNMVIVRLQITVTHNILLWTYTHTLTVAATGSPIASGTATCLWEQALAVALTLTSSTMIARDGIVKPNSRLYLPYRKNNNYGHTHTKIQQQSQHFVVRFVDTERENHQYKNKPWFSIGLLQKIFQRVTQRNIIGLYWLQHTHLQNFVYPRQPYWNQCEHYDYIMQLWTPSGRLMWGTCVYNYCI